MRRLLPLLAAALVLGACSTDDSDEDGFRVVATTTQAADLARAVGGDRVSVHALLDAGADPHDYEPRPSDATRIERAQLVIRSGGDLDEWLDDLLDSAGGDAARTTLLDRVTERRDDGEVDPHWWQDPRNGVAATRAIAAELIAADPDGRATYERNARALVARLERLDRHLAACFDAIPPARRKLVTTHDALGYFADRYGITVVGSIIPALSSQAQSSAGETQGLVDAIRREGVRAIFPETSIDARLERALADEAGVRVGGALYADTLGESGSAGATYLGSLEANADAIAEGLSGRSCP